MIPRIEIDRESGVLIEWPDGHHSRFAFDELRAACPCAACRDERDAGVGSRAGDRRAGEAANLLQITPIGRYAIGLVWGDGHSSGIYTWEYLRDRCDCFACRFGRREVQG